jgi:hypothetical protein
MDYCLDYQGSLALNSAEKPFRVNVWRSFMEKLETKVANRIRQQIVNGELPAGARLPNRDILKAHHGVSIAILQRGIDQLVREGFLEVGPRKLGTRVVNTPPHLHHYKIIFPVGRDLPVGIWKVLRDCAEAITVDEEDSRSFSFFYRISGHKDIEVYQAVVEEVLNKRVAGLILASESYEFIGTPILEHPGIPRSAIAQKGTLKHIPKILLDYESFLDLALTYFKHIGCRNVAVLARSSTLANHIKTAFKKNELPLADINLQFPAIHRRAERNFDPIRNLTKLLMQQPYPPDGLLVMGEQILEHVLTIVNPDDIPIVSLANFPTPNPHPKVRRFGFSIPQLLEILVQLIDDQKNGAVPHELNSLSAMSEALV